MARGGADTETKKLPARIERRIALTRGVMGLERVWDASWPASGIVLLFLTLSLFDVWRLVPPLAHVAALAAAMGATLFALWRTLRAYKTPTRAEAMRRLEVASALANRPLETVDDTLGPEAADPATRALWAAAQRQAAAALARLRTATPQSDLAVRDPRALRFAALLMVLLGLAFAGPDSGARIVAGLTPSFGRGLPSTVALDAWIDPPAYTGLAPVFLARGAISDADAAIVSVPEGARLTLRLSGGFHKARLELRAPGRGKGKPAIVDLARAKDGALTGTVDLALTSEATLRAGGRTLGHWPINVTPDAPPQIAFDGEVKPAPRGALRIPYKVSDDFGLKSVELQVRLADRLDSEILTLPLSTPAKETSAAKPARMRGYKDLTAHPWAGAQVVLTLVATDAKNQTGMSGPLTLVLPERTFHHPLARALVDARRRLATRADGVTFAGGFLKAATSPAAPSIEMSSVYLSLRLAYRQLEGTPSAEAVASASDLMWNAALALERGTGEDAERDLQAARDALSKALRENAPQEEIAQKMQALKDAVGRYLEELSRQMAQNGPTDPNAPVDPDMQLVTPEDFENLLRALENLTQTGANEQAEKLLGALDDILQNLQQPGQAYQPSPQDQARQQAMNDLGDIIGDQRKLMDETHRENETGELSDPGAQGSQGAPKDTPGNESRSGSGKRGESGKGGEDGKGTLADRQEGLRQRLGETMESLGEDTGDIPSALGRAERAMKDAQNALRDGNKMGALEDQKSALEALRDGAQSIAKAMDDARRQARAGAKGGRRGGTDPFGRPMAGTPNLDNTLDMPDKGEIQRAREILNEIRRRAAERGRPQSELDYLDRLLERF